MPDIELADITPSELLHEAGDGAHVGRRHQEMHVVVHQHIGVKHAPRRRQRLLEEFEISPTIEFVEKTREAVVSALHNMLRNTGKIESGLASHALIAPRPPKIHCNLRERRGVGLFIAADK